MAYTNPFSTLITRSNGQRVLASWWNSIHTALQNFADNATVNNITIEGEMSLAAATLDISTSITNDYSSTSVTTGAWVELIASTTDEVRALGVFDSSGQVLELGIGAAGSEVRKFLIFPGGNGRADGVRIASGSRISIKAVDGDASAGFLAINLYKKYS